MRERGRRRWREGKEVEGQEVERRERGGKKNRMGIKRGKSENEGWQSRRWIVERGTAGNLKRTEGGGNISEINSKTE